MKAQYALSAHVVTAVGDRPVAVDPFDVGVAWAYGLSWRPVPVMQPYFAYTRSLDERAARALLATPGLAVLREETVVDDRFQLWDTPPYHPHAGVSVPRAGSRPTVDPDGQGSQPLRPGSRTSADGRLCR
jgi:hypothetical protein